ncbi:MAG: sulfurtransferase TusA family protein [Candidatus Eiseniibacteriota bacterium]|nr:MAG: sulfurtransferase TusA family protein [Candidatus Eisenbacteria bacterium]
MRDAEGTKGGERKEIFLNLKGEASSHVFLRCKVELEGLSRGDVLEILVDDPSATVDIPKCLNEEGHAVLEVQRMGEAVWKIAVEKGGE